MPGRLRTVEPTPRLDKFLKSYQRDDSVWWTLACGHHMNLFDQAIERMQAAEKALASQSGHGSS